MSLCFMEHFLKSKADLRVIIWLIINLIDHSGA